MLGVVLDHYDKAARAYLDATELEKDDPKRIHLKGRYEALKDLVDDLRSQPQPTPQRTQGQAKQPRTLLGGLLAGRAQAIANDVMDGLEDNQGGG